VRRGEDVRYVVGAPAAELLRERGYAHRLIEPALFGAGPDALMERLVTEAVPKLVLLGSSPARGLSPETPEQFAILAARRKGVATLAVLDYWGMYAERFSGPSGKVELSLIPDRLCVLDELCRNDLIAFGIPEACMVVTHNPWLDQSVAIASQAPARRDQQIRTVIFASQPLEENAAARGWSISQNQLFSTLLACARESGQSWRLEVWPHVAETPGRWPETWPQQTGNVEVTTRRNGSLTHLAEASALATSHSTVAYEALHLGVPCLSLRFDLRREVGDIIDRLELAEAAGSRSELLRRLREIAEGTALAHLGRRRKDLVARRIFFSDGHAGDRVLSEVIKLLGEKVA